MKGLRALLVLASAAACVRLAAACVIDLDPPLGAVLDGAVEASPVAVDAADASDASAPDAPVATCVQDTDCRSEPGPGVGCIDEKCTSGQCVFDFCPTGNRCSIKSCDVEAGAGTCVGEQPIGFTAVQMSFVTDTAIGTLPCASGTNLTRCFAASYPFVYAAHTSVSPSTIFAFAYPVADLTVTNPTAIPIQGIDFVPANVVHSGKYIIFIGKVQVAASNNLLPIAWLEAPRGPRPTSMKATKVTVTYAAAASPAPSAFPAPNGSIMLVSGVNALRLAPPVPGNAVLVPYAPGAGTTVGAPVAESGDRLVLVATSATGTVTAQLIKNAGTGGGIVFPTAGQDVTAVTGHSASGQAMFAQSSEGTVVSNIALARFDAGTVVGTDAVRVSWLIAPDQAIETSADAGLVVANYVGLDTRVTGPVAAVDVARVVALGLEPPSATFAQLVERDDAGSVSANAMRRDTYDGGPATFSSVTSEGWVYVLQASSSGVTMLVLQPSCDVVP